MKQVASLAELKVFGEKQQKYQSPVYLRISRGDGQEEQKSWRHSICHRERGGFGARSWSVKSLCQKMFGIICEALFLSATIVIRRTLKVYNECEFLVLLLRRFSSSSLREENQFFMFYIYYIGMLQNYRIFFFYNNITNVTINKQEAITSLVPFIIFF